MEQRAQQQPSDYQVWAVAEDEDSNGDYVESTSLYAQDLAFEAACEVAYRQAVDFSRKSFVRRMGRTLS